MERVAVGVHDDDLAGLDFALVHGAHDVECARLRREHRLAVERAEHEGAPAARITRGDQRVANRDQDAVRAIHAAQCIGHAFLGAPRAASARGDARDLGIHGTTRRWSPGPRGRARSSPAFTILPLCASAMWPPRERASTGCAFSMRGRARGAVARVAERERAQERIDLSAWSPSDTSPMLRTARACAVIATDTMPADSWPRCCREIQPELASGCRVVMTPGPRRCRTSVRPPNADSSATSLRTRVPLHDGRDRVVDTRGEPRD